MKKITLVKKIRDIIKKHNDEAEEHGMLFTLLPAKEIADLVEKILNKES